MSERAAHALHESGSRGPLEAPAGRPRPAGFTLVETLFAAVVFLITALGLSASLAQGGTLADGEREARAAQEAIDAALARMRATPFSQLAEGYHGRGFAVDGLRPVAADPDGLAGEIGFAYGPDGDRDFYVVTVRVAWTGRLGERALERTQYFANVLGDTGVPAPLEQITGGEPVEIGLGIGEEGGDA